MGEFSSSVFGGLCLVAAIVAGGVKGAGFELPIINSIKRQILLGLVGVIFVVGGNLDEIISRLPWIKAENGTAATASTETANKPIPSTNKAPDVPDPAELNEPPTPQSDAWYPESGSLQAFGIGIGLPANGFAKIPQTISGVSPDGEATVSYDVTLPRMAGTDTSGKVSVTHYFDGTRRVYKTTWKKSYVGLGIDASCKSAMNEIINIIVRGFGPTTEPIRKYTRDKAPDWSQEEANAIGFVDHEVYLFVTSSHQVSMAVTGFVTGAAEGQSTFGRTCELLVLFEVPKKPIQ